LVKVFVLIIAVCFAVPTLSPAEQTASTINIEERSASELLACSIGYHDPNGSWRQGAFKITDISSRPDGSIGRRTVLRFDNREGRFNMESHIDGRVVTAAIKGSVIETVRLDGNADISSGEIQRYQLAPAQILTRRNFFLYLIGLPMKLRDSGTSLDPKAKRTNFHGRSVNELRVTYDASVGSDTWYFYLDWETCALVGHRFYHNESAGDGEYTILSDEIVGQGLRLPRIRKWYKNQDSEWFITHTIQSIEAP
jgi:hypothetical protein